MPWQRKDAERQKVARTVPSAESRSEAPGLPSPPAIIAAKNPRRVYGKRNCGVPSSLLDRSTGSSRDTSWGFTW